LRQHWPQVERLAAALAKARTLSGAQIDALVGELDHA
jgi:hypothetical protein